MKRLTVAKGPVTVAKESAPADASANTADSDFVEVQKGKQRRIYLTLRMKEIQAELKGLQAERKDVVERLKGIEDQKAPEAKALKERRIYLAHRPADLRAEFAAVQQKRKEMGLKP